jgi:4'-phosphopantetheinyl transferase
VTDVEIRSLAAPSGAVVAEVRTTAGDLTPLCSLLPVATRARLAARQLDPAARSLQLAAHAVLAVTVAHLAGIAESSSLTPSRTRCTHCGGPHGRYVEPQRPTVSFSLAHGAGLALVAVGRTRLGVDVQRTVGAQVVDLCAPRLHTDERRELDRGGARRRADAFTRTWVRKEAYGKAVGAGLCLPLDRTYLGRRVDAWTHDRRLQVTDLTSRPGYRAAVAVEIDAGALVASSDPTFHLVAGVGLREADRTIHELLADRAQRATEPSSGARP